MYTHFHFFNLFSFAQISLFLDPLSSVPSSAWMDHLWMGLINKSYEDYKKDNPYTSLNQEVDMQVRTFCYLLFELVYVFIGCIF